MNLLRGSKLKFVLGMCGMFNMQKEEVHVHMMYHRSTAAKGQRFLRGIR